MNATHWATDYIGLPWRYGAEGPEEFDCWGFVRYMQMQHYGIEMAAVGYAYTSVREAAEAIENSQVRKEWIEVPAPQEGDIVLMARNKIPVHVGIWIQANGTGCVLHCVQGTGVMCSHGRSLSVTGWGGVRYFRHFSKCTM